MNYELLEGLFEMGTHKWPWIFGRPFCLESVNLCVFPAMKWQFHTCGATGPGGPTPSQCTSTYRNTNVNVTVGTKGALKGVQMWKVPETGTYR